MLTSPNLNYVMIIGVTLLAISATTLTTAQAAVAWLVAKCIVSEADHFPTNAAFLHELTLLNNYYFISVMHL